MKNSALIVIDLQNDITKNYKEIIAKVNDAIDWAVQKLGFQYHHTCENVPVSLMNEFRKEHITAMTGEEWNSLCQGGK